MATPKTTTTATPVKVMRTTLAKKPKPAAGRSAAASSSKPGPKPARAPAAVPAASASGRKRRVVQQARALGATAVDVAATLTDLASDAAHHTLAFNPLVGLQGRDVASAASSLLKAVAGTPRKAGSHYVRYLKELGRVVKGDSELAPDPKDRRFTDAAWRSNALYRRLMQGFVATQK